VTDDASASGQPALFPRGSYGMDSSEDDEHSALVAPPFKDDLSPTAGRLQRMAECGFQADQLPEDPDRTLSIGELFIRGKATRGPKVRC
jgi:hypothetical protein